MKFEPLYYIDILESTAEMDRLRIGGAEGEVTVGGHTQRSTYEEVHGLEGGIGAPSVERPLAVAAAPAVKQASVEEFAVV